MIKFYSLRTINGSYLIILLLYCYVVGGGLQFFLGLSNTIISFIIPVSYLAISTLKLNIKISKKRFKLILLLVFIIGYVFVLSLINGRGFIRPMFYSLAFIIPFFIYVLINDNFAIPYRSIKLRALKKLLLYIAVFQTPILLLQKNFYNFFIQFERTSNHVNSYDFMFGSFLLKNDHTLGFFIVLNILYIWSYEVLRNRMQTMLVTIILIINLFLSGSNTSIIFLFGAILFLLLRGKTGELKISVKLLLSVIIIFTAYFLFEYLELKFYSDLMHKLGYRLDYKSSVHWLELGKARREQIILVLLHNGLSFFGNGAYSYFDILTGEFTKYFRHFSQLIWIYYDLGLLGIALFIYYMYKLYGICKLNREPFSSYLLFGLILYSFFTITTFDLSFMLTYFIYNRKDD